MGSRQIDPRLQKLYDEGTPVYSISRLDCMNRCMYEAYLTYVKHEKGEQNIYALLGTKIHDKLEELMNGEATEADLLPAMQEELADADMFGYSFPKMADGSDGIRNGWVKNMTHFCETYQAPKGKFITEEFVLYQTPKGRWIQGYLDLQKVTKGGILQIFDYKTSTAYKGEEIKEHGRQLVLYALAKEQEGHKVNSVSWIFLKYVELIFEGKKTPKSKEKTPIRKAVERKKIGTELSRHVADEMRERGYDELDIEVALDELVKTNKIDHLPDEIKSLYKIIPYVCTYPLTEESRQECIDYIDETIDRWEAATDYPPKEFTRMNKIGKSVPDVFFCTQLCGYGKKCQYLRDYLDSQGDFKSDDDDDLFG